MSKTKSLADLITDLQAENESLQFLKNFLIKPVKLSSDMTQKLYIKCSKSNVYMSKARRKSRVSPLLFHKVKCRGDRGGSSCLMQTK